VSALSDLLNQYIPEGVSNRELARKSEGAISRATIDKYRAGEHGDQPSEAVLRAFHELLAIPLPRIRAAAGLPPGEAKPWVPPVEADLMSRRQRRAVTELIRSFVERQGEVRDLETAAQSDASGEARQNEEAALADDSKGWTFQVDPEDLGETGAAGTGSG
jgi:hypothetical protein